MRGARAFSEVGGVRPRCGVTTVVRVALPAVAAGLLRRAEPLSLSHLQLSTVAYGLWRLSIRRCGAEAATA